MKFMHLADLHLGKNVNGALMIEDQKYALDNILKILEDENIKTLLIAGDIYQSSIPSSSAIKVFDDFLTRCINLDIKILIISGNHDSADRLSFASNILKGSNIFISRKYEGEIEKVVLEDEYGEINFYLFPYIKPYDVKRYFNDIEINTYSDAVKAVIDSIDIDESKRNVILSHQFILNSETSESEEIYAGEAEAVSARLYEKFDYIALGHIHKKQSFLDGKLRYPGALLKYALSESGYNKSITIVDLKEKGDIEIIEKEIKYLRDMRVIRGKFDDIVDLSKEDNNKHDYIHIELLDENDIYQGLQRLRSIYPNILTYKYINQKIGENNLENINSMESENNPLELFEEFYFERMGESLSKNKKDIIKESIENIWSKDESD